MGYGLLAGRSGGYRGHGVKLYRSSFLGLIVHVALASSPTEKRFPLFKGNE